ncbi:MAG TPA: hypothetical protein VF203_03980 [Burkholderiales bacterium]
MRAAALLVALHALPAAASPHILEPPSRPAAEPPLIERLRAPEAAIAASGRAHPAPAEERIAQLDTPLQPLTLTVRQVAVRGGPEARDAVHGEVDVGGSGRVAPESGVSGDVDGARRREGLRHRFERRGSRFETERTQVLRVQDGGRAHVSVGHSAPTVEQLLGIIGRRGVPLAPRSRYEELRTGFDLRPRVHGETVHLEITPYLAVPGRADGVYDIREITTTVTGRLGEWIDLGTAGANASETRRAVFEGVWNAGGERRTILVKVERAGGAD